MHVNQVCTGIIPEIVMAAVMITTVLDQILTAVGKK